MEYDELQRTSITTYTKHYYIGTERIAGALGTMKNLGLLCEVVWPGDQSIITEMGTKTIEAGDALIADYLAFEKDLQLPEPYLYETYICGDLDHHPENYDAYWYHPDHLGSSNYISNLDGNINQHMEYLPFGETLVEQHLNSYNSPYRFNAKELDEETGWYYYGARYYNPKWSIWLSVDPACALYPSFSPYAYTLQNPVRYTDPTGMVVEKAHKPLDWYKNKDTGEIEWFDGSYEIDGYKHLGYYVSQTDAYNNKTFYNGETKSMYYNGEFVKSYNREETLYSFVTSNFIAPVASFSEKIGQSLVNGFQGAGYGLYLSLSGQEPDFDADIFLMDFRSDLSYNNGKWIFRDPMSQGEQQYAKDFAIDATSTLLNFVDLPNILKSGNRVLDNINQFIRDNLIIEGMDNLFNYESD